MLSRLPPTLRPLVPGIALAVAILAAYTASLRGEFLWDDDLHITANATVAGPLGLKEIWTSSRALYFPLTLTNFWAQYALWGAEPFGYRVVTLLFHVGSALLLWRVLLALRVPGAWLGAALWALHPVQVESVAWICELKNTQSAVFFLAAILAWTRWLDGTRPPDASRPTAPPTRSGKAARKAVAAPVANASHGAYAWTLLFAVLAILSKPSTVMLPVVLGLCTWWRRGHLGWPDAVRLVPFFALSALAAGWTIWEQKFNSGAIGEAWDQTLPERFAIAGRVVWFYLGKLVWPNPLIFIYPRWEIDGANPAVYLGIAAFAAAAAALWLGRNGRLRPLFIAGVYFAALLFPVLGFFSVYFFRYSFVGDHFQYLAGMGPLALVGAGLASLPRRLPWLAGAAVLLPLTLLTALHTRAFLNNEALWRDTVAKNPAASMAWFNLGDVLSREGRHEEAIAAIGRGLEWRPGDPYALNDLGNALAILGRSEEAVALFRQALDAKPDFGSAHTNLGHALDDLGRPEEALRHYRRAVELEPDSPEILNNLGVALAKAGLPQEAQPHLEAALRLRPLDAPTHDNLAGTLRALGRIDEALRHHADSLRLKPDSAEAHANFGRTLRTAGRTGEAFAAFERALTLQPGLTSARVQYAHALAEAGRPDEARAALERAVDLDPASADARTNLGATLAEAGRLDEAIAQWRAAIEADPNFVAAHENLGNAYASRQRWTEAAAAFGEAVRIDGNTPGRRVQLAVSLVNAGRLADAVPHFEAALALQPGAAELHETFAQVLRALGRNRDAFHHFEEAARLRR